MNAQQFVAQLVVFLNDQNQAIVDLYDGSKYWSDKATEKIKELKEENEQLKQENEELKKENQGIQNKVIKLLDFVEVKQCVTRTEIKKWWNDD